MPIPVRVDGGGIANAIQFKDAAVWIDGEQRPRVTLRSTSDGMIVGNDERKTNTNGPFSVLHTDTRGDAALTEITEASAQQIIYYLNVAGSEATVKPRSAMDITLAIIAGSTTSFTQLQGAAFAFVNGAVSPSHVADLGVVNAWINNALTGVIDVASLFKAVKPTVANASGIGLLYGVKIGDLNIANVDAAIAIYVEAAKTWQLYLDGVQPSRMDGSLLLAKGSNVASAGSLFLNFDGNLQTVTGTTTINYIGTVAITAGTVVMLQFAASLTVTHNAGSVPANTAAILLAGAINFSATSNDILTLVYNGTNWCEVARTVI